MATSLIVGGDCLADISMVRGRPDVFGLVASDPTVSRLIAPLAGDTVPPDVPLIKPMQQRYIDESPFVLIATVGPEGAGLLAARRPAGLRPHRRSADTAAA